GAPLPYLTDSAIHMADVGVNLIGGCCGTTPEYIRRIAERLKGRKPSPRFVGQISNLSGPRDRLEICPTEAATRPPGSILDRLEDRPKRPLIVVELDPPRDLNYEPIVRRAQQLRDMGVDAITMGDNTVATLRMSNLFLAQIVEREADIPVV